jgi:hypothetical protein
MPTTSVPRLRTVDPFAPFLSPKVTKGIKELLLTGRVQEINFDFGSVLVHAHHFRDIAKLFVTDLHEKGIHVVINPDLIISESTPKHRRNAFYFSEFDSMYFESSNVLDDEEGRALAVHECVHALCDYRRRVTAIRSEEGAAMVAQAWYLLSADDEVVVFDDHLGPAWEIADRLRNRWLTTRKPVPLKASEINAARLQAARLGYENGHYSRNGIVAS